jgi:serine/threonine protein kinase
LNTPDESHHPTDEPRFIGDYRLVELLAEGPVTRVWLAEQISIGRNVVVEELRDDTPESRDQFVADIRAKASVSHPLIGSVYEAVTSDGHCFFAREHLAGATLAERLEARATLKPAQLAPLLRRLSEAQLHLEGHNLASGALDLEHIYLDERGMVRTTNLVIAGERDPSASGEDIARLGRHLRSLVAEGHPGTTRMLTLLGWMSGDDPEIIPLDWRKVHDYATQIDSQITDAKPLPAAPPTSPATTKRPTDSPKKPLLWGGIAAAMLLAALICWIVMRPARPTQHSLPDAIHVPAGSHPVSGGNRTKLPEFWISAHEVTIAEYKSFLDALDLLAPEQRDTYDHEDQPPTKSSHRPDDWEAMLAAAENLGSWNDHSVTPDCPAVNIDWWDAYAYCEWKRGRLPSQEEWFAALRLGKTKPADLVPAPWGPVTASESDLTPAGLHNMAGGVAEWTRRPAVNPALPMGGKKPVVVGASYLRPANGARAREWVESRSLRRPDLGFRIAFDYEPK